MVAGVVGGAAIPIITPIVPILSPTIIIVKGAVGVAATAAASTLGTAAATTLGTVAGVVSGPIGLATLGTTEEQISGLYTFDCWKPVLHDESTEPSKGKILKEVVTDSRIKEVTTAVNSNNPDLPHLILKNIWDEEFRIDYFDLPSIGLAPHAVRI